MNRERITGVRRPLTWLFDLDNTLHDASHASFAHTSDAMAEFIALQLDMPAADATALRQHYWQRYGATLLGLVRHHGVKAADFLEQTHRLPGLEQRLRCHAADRAALDRLPGQKYIVTNGPRAYADRVLRTLGLARCFNGVITIEDMVMFGQHRPKPDRRMLRRLLARLKQPAARCVLVEDTLSHQKAARRIGMRTVWMQAYLGLPSNPGRQVLAGRKPAYVCARIKRIRRLHSFARSA
ncbi:pyrimidine 5'-nucleotidase [Piscinibacter sakaiensis]|uniref:pyrimidine 5'-nucleotidase n=1 Tax=Piscinibacter sakaiensis TaxID=1547922 RepID=UPI003AAEF2F1